MKPIHNNLLINILIAVMLTLGSSCKDDKDDDPQQPVENLNPGPCDEGLNLAVSEVLHVFKAIDICELSSEPTDWGLVSASFIRADNSEIAPTVQYGIMDKFGDNNKPRKGNRMLVMSTGRARTPSQTGSCGSTGCTGTGLGMPPAGVPANVPGCPAALNIHDDVGLKLVMRVPLNATGFSIDHQFFTFDYPEFVCSAFNDQFVMLVNPAPVGSISGNTAFDSQSKPIGVNCSFLKPANTALLTNTGFDTWGDAASTGWLRTTVPVTGGTTITIRLLIFDVGDGASDSSVLIDNFQWLQGAVALQTISL
jgi:hypothetical protein